MVEDIRRMVEFGAMFTCTTKPGRRKLEAIRFHDDGDFYNQAYLDKCMMVVRAFPKLRFYAYTKSLHLKFPSLKNFRLVKSVGGRWDDRIDFRKDYHAVVFCSEADRVFAGYADGGGVDLPSLPTCPRKIGLVIHPPHMARLAKSSDGKTCLPS
jgi:hypothetical protein